MSDTTEQQPIIILKKKGGHGGAHGGAWKVAYADFVTAMMAFFLVMWLVTQSQEVKNNVAGYFNDPGGWGKKQGSQSILKGGQSLLKEPAPPKPSPNMSEQNAREVLKQAGDRIQSALNQLPDFESVKDHIEIEMTEEGLRIELIEAAGAADDSAYFFALGGADLSDKGVTILSAIAQELGRLGNKLVIEGHTDSRQYIYKNKYSNWELSADRANAARKLMETKGIKDSQVGEIRGFAAKRPRIADNPKDARNRRISIVVQTAPQPPSVELMEMHEMVGGKLVKDVANPAPVDPH